MSYEAAWLSEVLISGTSAGDSILIVRCVALHTARTFAVLMGEGPWQELSLRTAVVDNATTFVFSSGMTVTRIILARIPCTGYLTRPLWSSRTSLVHVR